MFDNVENALTEYLNIRALIMNIKCTKYGRQSNTHLFDIAMLDIIGPYAHARFVMQRDIVILNPSLQVLRNSNVLTLTDFQ
jgi:hypothetical protein